MGSSKNITATILIALISTLLLTNCALFKKKASQITVFHYNIFELDSPKIQGEEGKEQMDSLKKFLTSQFEQFPASIVSLNEIQFDKPQVPTGRYMTFGQNPQLFFAKIFGEKEANKWQFSFTEANTGSDAKKYKGKYLTSRDTFPKNVRTYADQVNYGLFPGQYSTALASRYPIVQKLEIKDLPWRDFNPKALVKSFRDGKGKKLPATMALFDKSFHDTVINVDGHPVHIITLHTVPAYNFGNKLSPNYERNRDQLRFLEWYLTGKTDIQIKLPAKWEHITPLPSETTYIALGDWNTDLNNEQNPGSKILKRLAAKGRLFPTEGATHESNGFGPKRRTMLLDYLFHSKDLFLKEAHVIRPKEKRLFLGCGKQSLPQKEEPGRKWVTFNEDKKTCHVTVSESFFHAKTSSDHFPLWASFELRRK